MASALLASRNESYWGERKVYMRKAPNSNPNPKLSPISNPNPNPNPNLNTNDHASDHQNQFHAIEADGPPASVAAAAVSDDSSSFNRKSISLNHRRDSGGYVTFSISTYSRRELRELKRRLVSELDQVRSVTSRIESKEFQSSARSVGYSTSGVYCGGREVTSSRHLPLPDSLVAGSESLMERPTQRANQYYHPPDLLAGKDKKLPAAAAPEFKKLPSATMKKCGQILTKLMKHKGAIWFNTPVDVVGMGLHDYYQIIKHPMDLGTVKSKLAKGLYTSPLDFASDIRLTFKNALLYNPEGHEVHKLADQFLRHFEGLFGPAYLKCEKQQGATLREEEEERQRVSSCSRVVPMPESAMRAEPTPVIPPPVQTAIQAKPAPLPQLQPQQQLPPQPILARTVMIGKQPKPKAKDPNKRLMSLEEKQKLSSALQNLPQEKMHQVLQIIRKRNVEMAQDGDEIELDFELMDPETLWELDRFVCNWKKMMSKIKRQEALAGSHLVSSAPPSAPAPPPLPAEAGDKSPMAGETPGALLAKKSKKGDPGDEDVDIGDDMPMTNYPSVEIEKDACYGSSSSSSGSDSSSSSDSDSGSSSGSDSEDDDDDAQSPAVGSRPSLGN